MSVSHRGILDYLRDEYGVARSAIDVTRSHGGHTKLKFEYDGRLRTVVLPSSPSDANWEMIKRYDIRRELGQPSCAKLTPTRRTLEDMTAELKVVAPQTAEDRLLTATGRMSFRRPNKTLSFSIPDAIRDHFIRVGESVAVEFIPDSNMWVLRHGPGPRFWPNTKGGLAIGGAKYLSLFGGYFRRHPMTCTLQRDGSITVTLDALPQVEHEAKPEEATALPPALEEALPRPAEQAGEVSAPSGRTTAGEDDMRAVLALVREIEAASPYRLTRVRRGDEDVLVWRAPTIE